MNRFEYVQAKLREDESFVSKDRGVKLYDGNEKTNFEDGEVVLTSHRLFWGRSGEIARAAVTLCLQLKYVASIDEETASSFFFGTKKRIILYLRQPASDKIPGPMDFSTEDFIKLSGTNGLDPSFSQALKEVVAARIWEVTDNSNAAPGAAPPRIKLRTGIVGIERSIQEKQKATDDSISLAFKDLQVLMKMAEEMVGISKSISRKIRERQGDISEDETIRFQSYLLSLGIDDPVTREGFSSNKEYFKSLSKQICEIMLDPIEEAGGMMSMADVYCRVNRARGLELLSPEDLLYACKQLDGPIKLREFPSGAMVLQLETQDVDAIAQQTAEQVEGADSLTIEELARMLSISILLARERLLAAERAGLLCRDESLAGLRFFPNKFLQDIEA